MNAEFTKLTRGFHQDMLRNFSSIDEMVSEALLCIEPEDVAGARAYLDELLSGRYDAAQLQDIWRASRADIYFHDDAMLLAVLRRLRAVIDTHPYLRRSN
jgi:hypothetical protein